jgi:hypothetical protein
MHSPAFAHPQPGVIPERAGRFDASTAFDVLWAQLAVIGVTISFCNAIVYYPLRSGLHNPPLLVPSCLLIMAVILFAPLLLPRTRLFSTINVRCAAMPLLSLAVLGGVLLALFVHAYLLLLYAAIFLAGARRALQLLRPEGWLSFAFCIAVGCIVGLYLFGTVQGLNYAGLFSPEQALLGTLNHDTTFHSSIAFLIQNFGIPSIGLDGIVLIKYHFGTHFWFAALGRLASAEPIYSYGAAVPIVAAPLLVVSVLLSAISIDHGRKPLAGYLLIAFALIFLSDRIGWQSYYISESYTFALIGLLLLLPLLAFLAGDDDYSARIAFVGITTALLAIPFLTLLKISVGALWTAAVGYIAIRRYGLTSFGILTGTLGIAILLAVLWSITPATKDYNTISNDLIMPFYFFRLFGLTSYSSIVIPMLFLLSKTRLYGGDGLFVSFTRKSDLMFEATIVVALLASIPPMVGIPQDSAVWYFFNVSQWIAIVLLAARLAPQTLPWPAHTVAVRSFPVMLAAVCVLVLTLFGDIYRQAMSVVIAADQKSGGTLLNGGKASQYFVGAVKGEHVMWDSAFRNVVLANAGNQLIQTVWHALNKPDKDVAVFIPPENSAFWSLSGACHEKHNLQVALTGQPSLFGAPPASYGCDPDVYTTLFGRDNNSRSISDADLCEHARRRNIKRVIIVAESKPSERNRVLDCQ